MAGAPRSPAGEMLRQAGDKGRAGVTSAVEAPKSQRRRGGSRGPPEAPSGEGERGMVPGAGTLEGLRGGYPGRGPSLP
jgi:hypothetical protein